jgi:phage FluMu protein Com
MIMICNFCSAELTRADTFVVRTNETVEVKCGKCAAVLDTWIPAREEKAQPTEPTVVHLNAAGEVRFPGRSDAPLPPGFEKVELRTIRERDRFERSINARENGKYAIYMENRERVYAEVERQNRSDLRARMTNMSNLGRDFARVAMERSNNKPRPRFDAGFMIEANHMNASNRGGECSERTGWRRKK